MKQNAEERGIQWQIGEEDEVRMDRFSNFPNLVIKTEWKRLCVYYKTIE